jgi:hypothetical protein
MRKLGDGHFLELRISEEQKKKIKPDGSKVILSDLLQVHHKQTAEDEKGEYLTATIDSIRGVLDSACEKIKEQQQIKTAFRPKVEWTEKREEVEQNIANKVIVSSAFEPRFLDDTSNEKYLQELDSELLSIGKPGSKVSVLAAIDKEITHCDTLIAFFQQNKDLKNDSEGNPAKEILLALETTKKSLKAKKADFETNWDKKYAKLMPKDATKKEGISESEAEAEQEAQQESQAEAVAIGQQVSGEQIDFSALSSQKQIKHPQLLVEEVLKLATKDQFVKDFKETMAKGRVITDELAEELDKFPSPFKITDCWSSSVQVTVPLLNTLDNFRGTRLPPIGLFITTPTEPGSQPIITAMLPSQIHNDFSSLRQDMKLSEKATCFSVVGTMVDGELQFVSHFAPTGSPKGKIEDQGRLLLTYLYLGHTLFSENNWKEMRQSFKAMPPEEQKNFSGKLKENLEKRNALFLEEAKSKLAM